MKMNRKATISIVVGLVAFLASSVAIIGFMAVVLPALHEATDREICRLSVFAKYAGGVAAGEEADINLKCYTQIIEIREDGVYKTGSDREPKLVEGYNDKELRTDVASRAIANEMYDCWNQFFEGKLQVFYESSKRCIICTEIIFHDNWNSGVKAGELGQGRFLKIGDFLNTQKVPGAGDLKYSTYLGGRFDPDFSIDTTQKTQVVYKGFEKSWASTIGGMIFGCSVLAVGALFTGPAAPLVVTGVVTFCLAQAVTYDYEKAVKKEAAQQKDKGKAAGEVSGDWISAMVIAPAANLKGSCDRLY